mmetsp:Transcript_9379/g.21460  ORF Transcript_9379/g.21460 Transcript_9379/m.21460 type:complete len:205 (-) Transcript_9379:628-1242(-)
MEGCGLSKRSFTAWPSLLGQETSTNTATDASMLAAPASTRGHLLGGGFPSPAAAAGISTRTATPPSVPKAARVSNFEKIRRSAAGNCSSVPASGCDAAPAGLDRVSRRSQTGSSARSTAFRRSARSLLCRAVSRKASKHSAFRFSRPSNSLARRSRSTRSASRCSLKPLTALAPSSLSLDSSSSSCSSDHPWSCGRICVSEGVG